MRIKDSRWLFLLASFLILVIVLGFSGNLYVSFLKSNYLKSVVASYSVAGGEAVRKIEYALKYGKSLDNFYGIEKMLTEIKQESALIVNVRIISPAGRVLYDTNGTVAGQNLGPKLVRLAEFRANEAGETYRIIEENSQYEVFLPIQDREQWVGNLNITFAEQHINAQITGYLHKTIAMIILIALLAAACFVLVIYVVPLVGATGQLMTRRLLVLLLVVLGLAQVFLGLNNILLFKSFYTDLARNNAGITAKIIQKNVDGIVSKGVAYSDLYHIEDWLNNIIKSVPEIAAIQIKTGSAATLYAATGPDNGNEAVSQAAAPAGYTYEIPLLADAAGRNYSLAVVLSARYIDNKIRNIALDAGTVLLVSLLFMVEVTLFLVRFLQQKLNAPAVPPQQGSTDFAIIRPLAFVFFISWAMSLSFIPVMMAGFYEPLFGLPPGVVLGLPVSAEALTTILSTIITGYFTDKRGWKPPFVSGLAVFGAGTLLSALAANEVSFILARCITGIGYGFSWMSIRGFAAMAPTGESKTAAFAGLNAGIYAGINCGVVLGAMLAEQIGFANVFYISSLLAFVTGLLTYRCAGNIIPDTTALDTSSKQSAATFWREVAAFARDRYILAFFLFIVIPSSICLMFLNYFLPVLAKSSQIPAADVGRAFLLYGLCVVYLGPFFAKFIGRQISLKAATILSNIICIAALFIFAATGGYYAAMLAVLLLGIASSIGLVAQNNYLLSLESVKLLGSGTALSLYSVVSKLGQVIGPIVFGGFIVFGMAGGVGIVGALLLVALLLFIVIARNEGKRKEIDAGVNS